MTESPIPHGTLNGATNRRCKCDLCKAAARSYRNKYRTKKRLEREQAERDASSPVQIEQLSLITQQVLRMREALTMSPDEKFRSAKIFDDLQKATGLSPFELQALLDEYAHLRIIEHERELVTLLHEAWQTRVASGVSSSALAHCRALARRIANSPFPKMNR